MSGKEFRGKNRGGGGYRGGNRPYFKENSYGGDFKDERNQYSKDYNKKSYNQEPKQYDDEKWDHDRAFQYNPQNTAPRRDSYDNQDYDYSKPHQKPRGNQSGYRGGYQQDNRGEDRNPRRGGKPPQNSNYSPDNYSNNDPYDKPQPTAQTYSYGRGGVRGVQARGGGQPLQANLLDELTGVPRASHQKESFRGGARGLNQHQHPQPARHQDFEDNSEDYKPFSNRGEHRGSFRDDRGERGGYRGRFRGSERGQYRGGERGNGDAFRGDRGNGGFRGNRGDRGDINGRGSHKGSTYNSHQNEYQNNGSGHYKSKNTQYQQNDHNKYEDDNHDVYEKHNPKNYNDSFQKRGGGQEYRQKDSYNHGYNSNQYRDSERSKPIVFSGEEPKPKNFKQRGGSGSHYNNGSSYSYEDKKFSSNNPSGNYKPSNKIPDYEDQQEVDYQHGRGNGRKPYNRHNKRGADSDLEWKHDQSERFRDYSPGRRGNFRGGDRGSFRGNPQDDHRRGHNKFEAFNKRHQKVVRRGTHHFRGGHPLRGAYKGRGGNRGAYQKGRGGYNSNFNGYQGDKGGSKSGHYNDEYDNPEELYTKVSKSNEEDAKNNEEEDNQGNSENDYSDDFEDDDYANESYSPRGAK